MDNIGVYFKSMLIYSVNISERNDEFISLFIKENSTQKVVDL